MGKENLLEILSADVSGRVRLIREFQEEIWNIDGDSNSPELEILRDLAYDLDFYEPNEQIRAEDASFYGDERLKEELTAALKLLDGIQEHP